MNTAASLATAAQMAGAAAMVARTPGSGAPRGLDFRAPGIAWLPAVWRRSATWRTVGRFVLWGPLVGGAPYALFVVTIPFIYLLGAVPALLAGFLFATWLHAGRGQLPHAGWRATMGAMCGATPAAAAALANITLSPGTSSPDGFWPMVLAVHGVPAAVVVSLFERPPRKRTR